MSFYRFAFELEGLPPMNTADGMHWRKRNKLKIDWEARVYYAVIHDRPEKPLSKARVSVTRCSTREPDFENLAQGGKFLLDGLVKAGILEDDCPRVIGQPEYLWEPARPKHGKVIITVESVDSEAH